MTEIGYALAFANTISPILPLGYAIAWLLACLGRGA